jgi:hydrogenase nickel incorporation protein HypA/HybF
LHEITLVSAIIQALNAKVAEFKVSKVLQVNLTIGAMTNVDHLTLTLAFETCTQGTMLEGAKIVIDAVPIKGKCEECAMEFLVLHYKFECPHCQSRDIEVIAGREFYIKDIQVE